MLITGSRAYKSRRNIQEFLKTLPQDTVVVTGGGRGADWLAEQAARFLRMELEVYPADWRRYGKAAGPIRNRRLLEEARPDLVAYFHDDLEHSRGTWDVVSRARKAGVPVVGNPHRGL